MPKFKILKTDGHTGDESLYMVVDSPADAQEYFRKWGDYIFTATQITDEEYETLKSQLDESKSN